MDRFTESFADTAGRATVAQRKADIAEQRGVIRKALERNGVSDADHIASIALYALACADWEVNKTERDS